VQVDVSRCQAGEEGEERGGLVHHFVRDLRGGRGEGEVSAWAGRRGDKGEGRVRTWEGEGCCGLWRILVDSWR